MTRTTTTPVSPAHTHTARATLIGLTAIGLWSTLALATASAGAIPPFQLTAVTFLIGGLVGAVGLARRPGALGVVLRQPLRVWAIGVGGLFGYHLAYFAALQNAPPAEASLIAYLWPLLIVLLSGLLPGERLATRHVVAALMGFAGTAILLTGGGGPGGGAADPARGGGNLLFGYACALACAVIWAVYSVASRRFAADAPSDTVAGFCLATAGLAAVCHLALERTVMPDAGAWLAILALGLGPVGLAFYTWDHGVKHGDLRLLGVASYAAPVLSTLLLVATGTTAPTVGLAAVCALIVGAAVIATRRR